MGDRATSLVWPWSCHLVAQRESRETSPICEYYFGGFNKVLNTLVYIDVVNMHGDGEGDGTRK